MGLKQGRSSDSWLELVRNFKVYEQLALFEKELRTDFSHPFEGVSGTPNLQGRE